ncbi:hypothetical protein [Novimethylophilus kurashikiensis]|nr:hypothetical protein [Novimethylophilus kurashikiensis]
MSVLTLSAFIASPAFSAPLSGEYEGAVHGYLIVNQVQPNHYKVWLGVSGGSCGGLVLINNLVAEVKQQTLSFKRREKERSCTTTIEFEDTTASISDSCIDQEWEEKTSTTCAMMGDYTKIKR